MTQFISTSEYLHEQVDVLSGQKRKAEIIGLRFKLSWLHEALCQLSALPRKCLLCLKFIFDSSSVQLEPDFPGGIVFNSGEVEILTGSLLSMGLDDGIPVTVNSGGVFGFMSLSDSSSMVLEGGSLVNMNVELESGSSIGSLQNSKIGGNLEIGGFSTYEGEDQVGPSVLGTVTCFTAEAFDFTVAGTPISLCI